MTENLLQKLEEKVTTLLTELETLRAEITSLKFENSLLVTEKLDSTTKLQNLISLLDMANMPNPSLGGNQFEISSTKNEYANA